MLKNILGYPRIGNQRELKKASENYWTGRINQEQLFETGKTIRFQNWKLQKEAGIDLIPSNDFSFYDQVLDMIMATGSIPARFQNLKNSVVSETELYFAMARGYQKGSLDITAMGMTKWFDTNYHFIVPEFVKNQKFTLSSSKILDQFIEAKEAGILTKPAIIGPVTFLLLGKEKEKNFNRIDLLFDLLPVYKQILKQLSDTGAKWVQFDEPVLATDLNEREIEAIEYVYRELPAKFPDLKFILTSYFDCYGKHLDKVLRLPVQAIHLDLVRCPAQLDDIINSGSLNNETILSLGLVAGRNIWKNDLSKSLEIIQHAKTKLGDDRLMISSSCSLLHSPCDLDMEAENENLKPEIRNWLAFAKQKVNEIACLAELAKDNPDSYSLKILDLNEKAQLDRKNSDLIHSKAVSVRTKSITEKDSRRYSAFYLRQQLQKEALGLPLFPTTTIGSFPQTSEVRKMRSALKKGDLSLEAYTELLKEETEMAIRTQENLGIDVLVHGEFERNDMVEYFGEKLNGFAFTKFGWVQSYGSRCVKPPIIYGDVSRPEPMTVFWSRFAQSLTNKPVKGMLTGPVTILQWSFARNDQPRSETFNQIALAIRDEVKDLESAGINIIQVDEPAIREGLPLRKEGWKNYLNWAVKAFRISTSGVKDQTQIHTHMCYSEFNDIIEDIRNMDADVITIECSRSQMELLDAFSEFKYPNEIGPGIYDIHSPRVPTLGEMVGLLEKASKVIPPGNLWVNPDCGLKTRHWDETKKALKAMVEAAEIMRKEVKATV